jgi:hypothetical protein
MMQTSTDPNRLHTASAISCAVVTDTNSTPFGAVSDVGPLTSVTSDETAKAASAMAYPIFPDERLEM